MMGLSTEKTGRREQASRSSKIRKKWCNGGASIRKEPLTCGKVVGIFEE